MKKEKNQKKDPLPKIQQDNRSRSQSPKPYFGCNTCKFKHNDLKKLKSASKLSVISSSQDKTKTIKTVEKDEKGEKEKVEEPKIKLTDLCDEDKKRIVELIQELSRMSDRNLQLKEMLERLQRDFKEQQEYVKKQSNIHIEEKNFYINEINEYKGRIEGLENELKSRTAQWKNESKFKENEINSLGKALQKSLAEKSEFQEQISHLKTCLKHSLESFQKLNQEGKKLKSVPCQTENVPFNEFISTTDEETGADECISTGNQDSVNARSSLDIINDKLEYVYQLLKRKSNGLSGNNSKKVDIDLAVFLKNQNQFNDNRTEDFDINILDEPLVDESDEEEAGDNYKFLKPFDQCSKTSVQAQRILKTLGKPFSLTLRESQKLDSSNLRKPRSKESLIGNSCSIILQNKIIQRNNLFKSTKDVEDQLLEDLFYSDHSLKEALGCQLDSGDLATK